MIFDVHENDFNALKIDDYPNLQALARFSLSIPVVPWFTRLGESLTRSDIQIAELYTTYMGFPSCEVGLITDWDVAGGAAENPGIDDFSWEIEEQLTAALYTSALEAVGQQEIGDALVHISAIAGNSAKMSIEESAALAGHSDSALLDAAAGAAVKACYQAALLLASGGDEEHALVHKYRLFESGRWPLGIVGSTLNLF